MQRLRAAQVPSHTLAAELLLMHVTGRERVWLYAHHEEPLEPAQAENYFELVARRISGTPTQYLTGKQEFWGLEFEVFPGVLIPRPETEHVVEVALERFSVQRGLSFAPHTSLGGASGGALRIADVGTGSGCLAIALAKEFPEATVVATDISAAAIEIARRNANRHSVSNRIQFVQCSLLDSLLCSPLATRHSPLSFDLIVSNPPYVGREEADLLPREVREHEPHDALFGGAHGSELYAPLIAQAGKLLRSGGIFVCEIGAGVLDHVRPLLADASIWTAIGVTNDLAGILRVLAAQRV
ncbi:MAG: peptide chain release factor N(5)-glutamine methyltransferase [Acidobacteria bacterium]|nr:peptide chain release factor N(5)-glutamine methyltransferase [Acidobacteriota bacterium]MBI3661953.1 peptide chain release factor N(5)-glutamine methyltransferase [Acidobacteriota bacterium]